MSRLSGGHTAVSIRDNTALCLDFFSTALQANDAAVANMSTLDTEIPQLDYGHLKIERDRFKIWTANAAAFADGRGSLDHRLRELPDELDQVKSLLGTISSRLQSYELAIRRMIDDTKVTSSQAILENVTQFITGKVSDAESDENLEAKRSSNPLPFDFDEAFESIHISIDWLHRLSNLLRKASVINQNMHAQSYLVADMDAEGLKNYFAWIVRRHFPGLSEELKGRMASTMVERHRRVLYRRQRYRAGWKQANFYHLQEKLATESTKKTELDSVSSNAFDPSTPAPKQQDPESERPAREALSLSSKVAITEPNPSRFFAPSSIGTGRSAALDNDAENLIPPPPPQCRRQPNFTCNLCCMILDSRVGKDRAQWTKHVKQDLDAYVCLFDRCDQPFDIFATNKDWLHHMQSEHLVSWICPVVDHSTAKFNTKEDLSAHMREAHANTFSLELLPYMMEACRSTSEVKFNSCPFCDVTDSVTDTHISHHLRYLALKSIPSPDSEDNVEEEAGQSDSLELTDKSINRETLDQVFGPPESGSIHSYNRQNGSIASEYGGDSFLLAPEQQAEASPLWTGLGDRDDRQHEWGFMESIYEQHKDWKAFLALELQIKQKRANVSQPGDYIVGWICAIKVEYVAAQVFLDEEYEGPAFVSQHDNNSYTLGRIGKYNVVIATLPFGEYGTTSAATVARDMVHSFPNIRIWLTVGIGGGAPSEKHDIRLGDIVVGTPSNGNSGLFQYDFGKNIQGQPYQTTGTLNRPPTALLTALAGLQSRYERNGHKLEEAVSDVLEKNKRLQRQYKRPNPSSDGLYRSEVVHSDTKQGCTAACDPSGLIQRSERAEDEDNPAIHYGLIAPANQLMKNALHRDSLAMEKEVLCFETEAAGLMNHFPCLVIRGICDYSDSHKNKEWQGYAAMMAAAYAKDLLYQILLHTVQAEKKLSDVFSGLPEAIEEHHDSIEKNFQAHEDLAQKKAQTERQKCHQLFRLTTRDRDTTYEWYKDRVENRVEDTCMWFLNHDHFKKWLEQDSGPLLVTADPGCGKSVLAKYLIDHILPQSTDTVCYFFFKDEDQNTMRQALCALLHQLFSKKPFLIKHAIPQYRTNGRGLINSTESLWNILHYAIMDPSNTESIVIVLDALDECAESGFIDLVRNIKRQFSDNQMGYSKLKYLLTCRPYGRIVSKFRSLLSIFPYIRIPGEEESDAISREVDLVITYRVDLLAADKLLSLQIKNELEKRLKQANNRTYLWIYLIFDYLKKENSKKTQKAIMSIITTLPGTVNEAYNQILSKSMDHLITRKVLSIVLAAGRPLTVTEMNIAVNIDFQSTRDLDLEYDKDFETNLRSCCGLFISIYHGKIYFLHQTAREFLVDTALSTATSTKLLWHHSITMRNAHAVLAQVCVLYLNLFNDSTRLSTDTISDDDHSSHGDGYGFLDYSARFWNAHFHEAGIMNENAIIPFALRICDPNSTTYRKWFDNYWKTLDLANFTAIGTAKPLMETDLLVAACCGHAVLVKQLLSQGADIEAKDARYERTPLWWASLNGHEAVVKLLLEKGADIGVKDAESGWTPLWCAVVADHEAITDILLENGADIEAKDKEGRTLLLWAASRAHEATVRLLLGKGAYVNAKNSIGRGPLTGAVCYGNEATVKLLLENGADIEAKDISIQTPLMYAISYGTEAVVKLLLEQGADVEAKGMAGMTSLFCTVSGGHKGAVKLLLEKGVNVNVKRYGGDTPLLWAASGGHEGIVKLLLEKGADVNVKNDDGDTSLSLARRKGYKAIVELLKRNSQS